MRGVRLKEARKNASGLKTRKGEADAHSAREVLFAFRLRLPDAAFRSAPVEARRHWL